MSFVGLQNYDDLVNGASRLAGLRHLAAQQRLVRGVRRPLQTALSLFLAVLVNKQVLRGTRVLQDGLLLPVRDQLGRHHSRLAVPLHPVRCREQGAVLRRGPGPAWFQDPSGVVHNVLGAVGITAPTVLAEHELLGVTWWTGSPARRSP